MSSNKKVVQNTLTKSEYKALVETLSCKQLSIQQALRDAAIKMIEEENKLDPEDSFFKIKAAVKGSGQGDLRYLYLKTQNKVKRR